MSDRITIQTITGKGRGLVAGKAIAKGETLWSETGLSAAGPDAYRAWAELAARCTFVGQLAVAEPKLAHIQKHESYWLKRKPKTWADAEWLRAVAQVSTNCFDHNGRLYLWQIVSLINHGCVGNVLFTVDAKQQRCTVSARTDIAAGEELVFRYLGGPCKPETLKSVWGFTCACAR